MAMRRRSARLSSIGVSDSLDSVRELFHPGAGVSDSLDSTGMFSTRFSLPAFLKQLKRLTADQRSAIERTGFGNLLLLPNQTVNKSLLDELMRRWSSHKHAFVLPAGEIRITSMDVALILGLRVVGARVILDDDLPFMDLEREYGAEMWNRKITVASLKSRLNSLGEICDDDFVRTFLLYAFGTFLFPNANAKVDSRYVYFMRNVDGVCEFAWGTAVLEDVFMWLDRRKEMNVQYVGSCLAFLQIWSYEHIDIARPPLLDSCVAFPRICQWDKTSSHNRPELVAKFKDLVDQQVTWELQPTSLESEIDIVKELLEAKKNSEEHLEAEHSSTNSLIVTGINFETRQMDKQVMEVETESETSSIVEGQKGRRGNLDNLRHNIPEVITEGINFHTKLKVMDKQDIQVETESETSSMSEGENGRWGNLDKLTQNVTEVVTDIVECSSTPCCMSKIQEEPNLVAPLNHGRTIIVTEDEEYLRTRIQMLEEKNMELERELDELKNQPLSYSQLEEKNAQLKREVDDLRRENLLLSLSSNGFVDRLEKILLGEDINVNEESLPTQDQVLETANASVS